MGTVARYRLRQSTERHRMKRHNKGRIGGPFVPMLKHTMKQPAWIALSHGARSLYIALKSRYNSTLGNAVYVSTRAAVCELGSYSHRDNVRRWFRELQYYGFIVMVSPGCLGVEGRGKAPHWRLTEEWYLGQVPTRDFQHWDGVIFHEQKPPSHYIKAGKFGRPKKQNPGPPVRSTVDHPFRPVVDHPSGPPPLESGPPVQAIQPRKPGPPVQAITSSTTPMLRSSEAGTAVGQSPALPWSDPIIDDDIPTFLRRGHPDCFVKE
jgi:hypothetical protein